MSAGIHTFEALRKADPRKVETVTGRKYPYGNQLKEALDTLPPAVEVQICGFEGGQEGDHEGRERHAVELKLVRKEAPSAKASWAHLVSPFPFWFWAVEGPFCFHGLSLPPLFPQAFLYRRLTVCAYPALDALLWLYRSWGTPFPTSCSTMRESGEPLSGSKALRPGTRRTAVKRPRWALPDILLTHMHVMWSLYSRC